MVVRWARVSQDVGRSVALERASGGASSCGRATHDRSGTFIFLSFILSTGGEHINPYYRPNHKKKRNGHIKNTGDE